jgi:hypothetical protein
VVTVVTQQAAEMPGSGIAHFLVDARTREKAVCSYESYTVLHAITPDIARAERSKEDFETFLSCSVSANIYLYMYF